MNKSCQCFDVPISCNLRTLESRYMIGSNVFIFTTENSSFKNILDAIITICVHKVLFHIKDVISSCIFLIGQLSKETQAQTKNNRCYHKFSTRQGSQVGTNTGLLNKLLISPRPYLPSLSCIPRRKKRSESKVLIMSPANNESI